MARYGATGNLKVGSKCPTCKKGKLTAGELPEWDKGEGRKALECPKCGVSYPDLRGAGKAQG